MSDVTLDLFDRSLEFYQPSDGYRFNEDAIWLTRFFRATYEPSRSGRLADLGCGVGVLGLWCLANYPELTGAGFEIQEEPARLAGDNAQRLGLAGRFEVHLCDLREHKKKNHPLAHDSYDWAIANPPYYREGSGRVNPDEKKAEARHERSLPLENWLGAAVWALRDGGALWCVYPASRAIDLIDQMRKARLEPKAIQWLHSFPDKPARRLLVMATKFGRSECRVLPPVFMQDGEI